MTKSDKTPLPLASALGMSAGETHTFENRKGHKLTVELIPGGLYEIAEFEELSRRGNEAGVIGDIAKQFENLVLERVKLLELGPDGEVKSRVGAVDVRTFFRTATPEQVMQHMTVLISGVKPDPKAEPILQLTGGGS